MAIVCRLRAPALEAGPEGVYRRDVGDRELDLHVPQPKLTALGEQLPILPDHRAPVVVATPSVAALLVGIQIDPPRLGRRGPDEVDALVQFPQLVMGTRPVGEDVHPVQPHGDVGTVGREELLARFAPQDAVLETQHQNTDRNSAGMLREMREKIFGQMKFFGLLGAVVGLIAPLREPARLAVVAVIREIHLRPNREDFPIQTERTAVVGHAAVDGRQADIAQNVIRKIIGQQLGETVPGEDNSVDLEEVVLAAVAGDLQLGAEPEPTARGLGNSDGLADALQVAVEVQRPLVQIAGGEGNELLRHGSWVDGYFCLVDSRASDLDFLCCEFGVNNSGTPSSPYNPIVELRRPYPLVYKKKLKSYTLQNRPRAALPVNGFSYIFRPTTSPNSFKIINQEREATNKTFFRHEDVPLTPAAVQISRSEVTSDHMPAWPVIHAPSRSFRKISILDHLIPNTQADLRPILALEQSGGRRKDWTQKMSDEMISHILILFAHDERRGPPRTPTRTPHP